MSRPIKLTDELRKSVLEEFLKTITGFKMSDGKVTFTKSFTYKGEDKAKILFTSVAYTKMVSLIMDYNSEVAWHGVGSRLDESTYLISDIVVYPQTVSGSNVEMDEEEYANWLIDNINDDRFNHIVMQGHSHVNFSTKPSAVDLKHQEDILSQLTEDMFYIFLIWNKKLEHHTKIYDLKNNTLYEDNDITYGFYDEGADIEAFVKESHELVKTRTYTAKGTNTKTTTAVAATSSKGSAGTSIKSKPKTDTGSETTKIVPGFGSGSYYGRGDEYMENYANDFYYNPYNGR